MKKIFLILVICIGFGASNLLNAQWVCDNTYWGDKYAYNTSTDKSAFFRVGEYWERETFLGTAATIPLCLIEKNAAYPMDGKYFKISFLVDGVVLATYLLEANLSQDFYSKKGVASYTLSIPKEDKPLFWKHFKQATMMKIRYNVIGIDALYEFDMNGSLKAFNHVINGGTPSWDK